jgi:DNA-binding transcriptional regulator of glucitol operon
MTESLADLEQFLEQIIPSLPSCTKRSLYAQYCSACGKKARTSQKGSVTLVDLEPFRGKRKHSLQWSTFQRHFTKLEERQRLLVDKERKRLLLEKERRKVLQKEQRILAEEGRLQREQQRQEEEDRYRHLEQLILVTEERLHKEKQRRAEEDFEELELRGRVRKEQLKQRTEIGRQRCANMILPLTQSEEERVTIALCAEGVTVVRGPTRSQVSQMSMATLKFGEWLGDEVCNYMSQLILEQEEVMCDDNPAMTIHQQRGHFVSSLFFIQR